MVEKRLAQLEQDVAPLQLRRFRLNLLQLLEGGLQVLVPETDVLVGGVVQHRRVALRHLVLFEILDDDLHLFRGHLHGVGIACPLDVASAGAVELHCLDEACSAQTEKRQDYDDPKYQLPGLLAFSIHGAPPVWVHRLVRDENLSIFSDRLYIVEQNSMTENLVFVNTKTVMKLNIAF